MFVGGCVCAALAAASATRFIFSLAGVLFAAVDGSTSFPATPWAASRCISTGDCSCTLCADVFSRCIELRAALNSRSALFIALRVLYSETMSCISLIRAGSGLVLFRTSPNSFAYAPMRERDLRGSLASSGVKYLSWALDGSKCSATAVLLALFMPDTISGALNNPAISAPIIAEYRASSLSRSISLFSPAAIFLNTGSKTDCRYSSVASLPMSAT